MEDKDVKSEPKKSVSSRVDSKVYDHLERVSNLQGHRFFDRGMSDKVAKILEDWYQQEEKPMDKKYDDTNKRGTLETEDSEKIH